MKQDADPADYIQPLDMNGLQGRMAYLPPPPRHQREILVLYGHHGLIERWWGLLENFNAFGAVTMPDLPGFGGMDSFRKIGKQPTIDNFADYLAAFVKMRYKNRRVTIAAISFSFVVVTRMLQRYPELADKVDAVISIAGFMHRDDFLFKPRNRKHMAFWTGVFAHQPIPFIIRYGFLNKFVISQGYLRIGAGKRRFLEMQPEDFKETMDFEVKLWQVNDVRTHWATTSEFLKIDNCTQPIKLPVWHVAATHDHYFNNDIVEQHMRVVFSDYKRFIMKSKAHVPSVLAGKKELGVMVPPDLRRYLRRKTVK